MIVNNRKKISVALIVSLVGFIFLVIFETWILVFTGKISDKMVDELAVQDFLERGNRAVSIFAASSLMNETNISDDAWQDFTDSVDPLASFVPSLRFLKISRGKEDNLYHYFPSFREYCGCANAVVVHHRDVSTSENRNIVVFRIADFCSAHSNLVLEVGLDHDVFNTSTVDAYRESIQQSLHLGFVLFTICTILALGIFIWRIIYEKRVIARQRDEEHLLFSGVLANSIVHDFRNPMSSLKLDIQMLGRECRRSEGVRAAQVTKLTDRIEKTIGRMDEIFREFLYLSRPADSTGGEFDLRACIVSSLELLAPRLEAQHLVGQFDAPYDTMMVIASESALRRVCVNVLMNAIQHSPDGGKITLKATLEGNFWQVDISDEGPGISFADRKQIFDMFYTKRSGGTGLGLFLARSALTNCGGSIEALPSSVGALFRVRVPAAHSATGMPLPPPNANA